MTARGSSVRRLRTVALIGLLCPALLTLAACAGNAPEQVRRPQGEGAEKPKDGRPGKRRDPATAPVPRESLDEAVRRFTSAVRSGDCGRVRSVAFFGPAQLDQRACGQLLSQLNGFEPRGSEEYGTAGVLDFTATRGAGTVGFLLGQDGRYNWALRFARQPDDQVVGSSPPRANRFDEVAQSATNALREGRCDQLAQAAKGVLPDPELPKITCEKGVRSRKQLARDRDARPQQLGANSRVAFYSLLPKPSGPYLTLVVLREGRRAAFQRAFPVPALRPTRPRGSERGARR